MDKFVYSLLGWIDERIKFLDNIVENIYTIDFPNSNKEKHEDKRNTSVAMPIKNMIGIVIAVAMGVFGYTEVTARLTR